MNPELESLIEREASLIMQEIKDMWGAEAAAQVAEKLAEAYIAKASALRAAIN